METPEQIETKIEERLKKQHRFTVEDMAANTGFEINDAKRAIDKLMKKYVCRIQVNTHGDIIYDFGKTLQRRSSKTFKEYFDAVVNFSWKAFQVLFKVWITIMLVVYFIIFLILIIGLIVAMFTKSSSGKSSGKSSGSGQLLALVFRLFAELMYWKTITGATHYNKDKYGYPYKKYNSAQSVISKYSDKKADSKKFVASVFDFVFGPKRFEINPLNNQMEVATYLRQSKGIITISEMKALAGWDEEQAGTFFSDCIVRFEGESKISENGVFYGDFNNFVRSVSQEKGVDIIWYWNEYEPEFILTGNPKGRNAIIIGMNLFNLVVSSIVLSAYYNSASTLDVEYFNFAGVEIVLGWIPAIFSALFFLIPTVRYFQNRFKEKNRHIQNIKKRLMRLIYMNQGREIKLTDIQSTVNKTNGGEEKLSKNIIEKTMSDFIYDWGGEMEVRDDATVVYRFPKLEREMSEAARLRSLQTDAPEGVNNIAFDTDYYSA